jgi:glycolate oxidase
MGGSATGEHGIGIEKINLMEYAYNPDTLRAMEELRAVFNPTGSFNPSKILPSSRGCVEIGKAYKVAEAVATAANQYLGTPFLRRGVPL